MRFKMAAHGASGADFVSGDAKPRGGGTDDYICKYRIVPEDAGKQVAIMIGKWSVDLEGNPLAAFYRHSVKLQVKPTAAAPAHLEQASDPPPEPTAPESAETTPLTIVSITHYRDGSKTPIAEGEQVALGTTLVTEIVFSASVKVDDTLRITYPANRGEKRYIPSRGGVHWRGTCQPGKRQNSVRCKAAASVDPFIVGVQTASALNGNTLDEPVTAPEVDVDTIQLSNSRIDENQPIGSRVGTFRIPVRKRVAYSLVAGTEAFSIADGTKLVTNKVFNHEVQWGYEITVRETDRDTNESAEKAYTLFISDVNEAPTDLRLTGTTFYREDGVGTKIGELVITDEDREDEHHVSITQGGEYIGYDDGFLHVLKLFDQPRKEITVEVTDQAGLAYSETFLIQMQSRGASTAETSSRTDTSAPSDASEDTPPPQEDESEDDLDPVRDSDGDGVPDDVDKHPSNPFLASLKKSIRHKTGQAQAEDSHLLI